MPVMNLQKKERKPEGVREGGREKANGQSGILGEGCMAVVLSWGYSACRALLAIF